MMADDDDDDILEVCVRTADEVTKERSATGDCSPQCKHCLSLTASIIFTGSVCVCVCVCVCTLPAFLAAAGCLTA